MRRTTHDRKALNPNVDVNADVKLLNPLAQFTNSGIGTVHAGAAGTLPPSPRAPKRIAGKVRNESQQPLGQLELSVQGATCPVVTISLKCSGALGNFGTS